MPDSAKKPGAELARALPVFLALALRLANLGHLNLWGDEAWALYANTIGLARLTMETGRDIHPPLYYYLVYGWTRLAGESEFALRYLSVFAGTLLVAAVVVLGRRLAGPRMGLLAAAVMVLAPFAVHYSQEARPFVWVMLWCALGLYALLRAVGTPSCRWWGAYAAFSLFAAMTSYPTAFWFGVHGLLLLARRAWRRQWWTWFGIELGVLVLALPWLLFFSRDIQAHLAGQGAFTGREALPLPELLGRLFYGLLAGVTLPQGPALILSGLLLAVGIGGVWIARRRNWATAAALGALALGPVLVLYPIHTRFPWFEPRVLAFCAIPLYLLLALGLEGWWSRRPWAGVLAGLIMIGALGAGLVDYFFRFDRYDPALEDYDPLIAHVQARAEPGDVLLYNANWQVGYFQAYYHGPRLTFYPFSEDAVAQATQDPRQVWVLLRDLVRRPGGERPEDRIEDALSARSFKVGEAWFGHIRLAHYVVPPAGTPAWQTVDASFQGAGADPAEIRLNGFAIQPELHEGRLAVAPGQAIYLTLDWLPVQPIKGAYHVFAQVVGPFNPARGNPLWAQHDGVPANQEQPTPGWTVGEHVTDRHVLWLDADAPPGVYLLQVGMYDPETGERLAVIGPDGSLSDAFVLATVDVTAP